jgi:hypothetical protein
MRTGLFLLFQVVWLLATACFAQSATASPTVQQDTEYDLVVIEGTPGGVACAVRAAREGLNVALVNRTEHLGGILSSGLGVWDTLWEGKRSPVYDELRQSIFDHYKTTYGEKSQQYRDALPGKSGHTNGKFEPHVVEKLITNLVAREPNITLLKGYIPVAVRRDGRRLTEVTIRNFKGTETIRIRAMIFADCSYEGDLLPLDAVAAGSIAVVGDLADLANLGDRGSSMVTPSSACRGTNPTRRSPESPSHRAGSRAAVADSHRNRRRSSCCRRS